MSCHGPDADLVSAVDAEGLLCRVALEAMHTGHFTFGISMEFVEFHLC